MCRVAKKTRNLSPERGVIPNDVQAKWTYSGLSPTWGSYSEYTDPTFFVELSLFPARGSYSERRLKYESKKISLSPVRGSCSLKNGLKISKVRAFVPVQEVIPRKRVCYGK